jgi:hypothetical protein
MAHQSAFLGGRSLPLEPRGWLSLPNLPEATGQGSFLLRITVAGALEDTKGFSSDLNGKVEDSQTCSVNMQCATSVIRSTTTLYTIAALTLPLSLPAILWFNNGVVYQRTRLVRFLRRRVDFSRRRPEALDWTNFQFDSERCLARDHHSMDRDDLRTGKLADSRIDRDRHGVI